MAFGGPSAKKRSIRNQKETLLRVYKTYVEPVINYAAAIWAPNASPSSIASIQRAQNRALRIATGCHMAASISHLHQECQFAFVNDHLRMLCTQLLASASRDSHPSNAVVTLPSGPRSMKATLQSKFQPLLQPHLSDGFVDQGNYSSILKSIHTSAVSATIANLAPNPVLGAKPPPISASEKNLSRIQRTTLSQLRSGHCKFLGDYKVLTGQGTSAICPECLFRRQTVPHLFNCDACPTNLSLRDLWVNPVTVANFLVTLSSFAALVPPDPPPARPPPEPPP